MKLWESALFPQLHAIYTMNDLYHISEQSDIARFEPRPPPNAQSGVTEAVVWAVDGAHLHNYLLPRDCPRVTFYPVATSTPHDVEQLMNGSSARYIIAIESGWLATLRTSRLYQYLLPADTFAVLDAGAGYHISHQPVVPLEVRAIDDILAALLLHDVELRITPSLWPLRDRVIDSTLQFSIIRMRNAQPPSKGYVPRYAM